MVIGSTLIILFSFPVQLEFSFKSQVSFDSSWIIPVQAFSFLSIRKQSCFSLKGIRPSGTDSGSNAMLAQVGPQSRDEAASRGVRRPLDRAPLWPESRPILPGAGCWGHRGFFPLSLLTDWLGTDVAMDGKEPCSPSFVWAPGQHTEAKSVEHRVAWRWVQSPQRVEPREQRQPASWRCLFTVLYPTEAGGHLCGCSSSPELSRSKPTAMLQLRSGYPVSRFPTSWRLGYLGVNSNLSWSPNGFYVWQYVNLKRKPVEVFHNFEAQLKWFLQSIF